MSWEKRLYTKAEIEEKLTKIANNMMHHFWDDERLKEHHIKVKENRRLSRSIGVYRYIANDGWIELSGQLLDYGHIETILDTLLHEVTHYVLHALGKPFDDGHPYFESELKRVGASSTRTCTVGRIHRFTCSEECENNMNIADLRNISGKYRCSRCKSILRLLHVEFHDGIGGVIIEAC